MQENINVLVRMRKPDGTSYLFDAPFPLEDKLKVNEDDLREDDPDFIADASYKYNSKSGTWVKD